MDEIRNRIRLIRFFQDNGYLERAIQINAYRNYENYLDYFVCEKLSPLKYLKTRIKTKLFKADDCIRKTEELLSSIDPKEYICVVSPLFKEKKLDGYYKRVEQADVDVLKDYKKIYLDYTQLGNRQFSINRFDDEHISIVFNSFNERHLESVKSVLNAIGKVYIHSIHMLMPDIVNYRLLEILFKDEYKTVLDLHGAVPEELKQFDTEDRSILAEFVDEIAIRLADKVVCMSQAMTDYYISKYHVDPDKMITMSIMPFKDLDEQIKDKDPQDKIGVVYAGGIQKWQNIDLIKESVKTNLGNYSFKIFTHDYEQLKNDWSDIQNENLMIGSRSNQEIYKEYEDCDFGFLLRDDNIVNNVACPTKMMEYIRYGIIPILKSDRIGNFKEYGLMYVKLEDFNKGIIPNENERKEIIRNNYQILLRIIEQSNDGLKMIVDYLK